MQTKKSPQVWREHLAKFKASDLSRAEYCRQNDLHPSRMTYYAHKFSGKPTPPKSEVSAFVRAQAAPPVKVDHTPTLIRVILGPGLVVECGGEVEPSWIIRLAQAARGAL